MNDLALLLPNIYRDIKETDALMQAENFLFDILGYQFNKTLNNQFVITADLDGILEYEKIFGISANPATEDLEFRRQRILNRMSIKPPFTLRFLKQRLNEIIGVGAWEAYLDYENYTLYIETAVQNQIWYKELQITINRIKPANIVFINRPVNYRTIVAGETVSKTSRIDNYRLGVSWNLGAKAFSTFTDEEVIKLPNIRSIQQGMLNTVAGFTASAVAYAIINNTYRINSADFISAESVDNEAIISYNVPSSSGLGFITNVKLYDAQDILLEESSLYVDNSFDVQMKHKIKFKEAE